jgi:hypothetical protein
VTDHEANSRLSPEETSEILLDWARDYAQANLIQKALFPNVPDPAGADHVYSAKSVRRFRSSSLVQKDSSDHH